MAEADDTGRHALQFVADEFVAVPVAVTAQRLVSLADALGNAQHQRQAMLGDSLAIAAGLVNHEYASIRASWDVDRVGAGAVGRDHE